MKDVTAQVSSS
jgi:hypothetical protein